MKIRYKITLGYVLVALLAGFTPLAALHSYHRIDAAFEHLISPSPPVTDALENLRAAGTSIVSSTGELSLIYTEARSASKNEIESGKEDLENRIAREKQKLTVSGYNQFQSSLKLYESLIKTSAGPEAGYLAEIRRNGDDLENLSSQLIEMKKQGVTGEDSLKLKEKFQDQETAYFRAVDEASRYEHEQSANQRINAMAAISDSSQTMYLAAFLIFLLAVGSVFYISHVISGRFAKLKKLSEKAGHGDLETQSEIETDDEIGDLARSFNKMHGDLKKSRSNLAIVKNFTGEVLNSMVDFVVVVNMDLTISQVNKAALEINGYTEDEIIGKPVNMLIGDTPFTERDIDILRENGGAVPDLEKLNLNKDGSLTPILLSMSIIKDDRGEESGIVCVGKNISAHKRRKMEREILTEIVRGASLTSNLTKLFKIAHESISKLISAENCFIALYNPAADLIEFEYWADKFDPVPLSYSPGKGFTSYILRKGVPILLDEELKNRMYESGDVEKAGSDFASWLGVPLRCGSQTIGVLAVQHYEKSNAYSKRDLDLLVAVGDQLALAIERSRTEIKLKESKAQLKAAHRIANLGSWQWDILTNQVRWSDEQYRIFGLPPQEFEPNFEVFLNRTHPEDRKQLENNVKNAFNTKLFSNISYRIIRPDGVVRLLQTNGEVIVDETGNIVKILGTSQDITERRQAEKDMERLNQQIESQRRRLNNLIDNVHEAIWEVSAVSDNSAWSIDN